MTQLKQLNMLTPGSLYTTLLGGISLLILYKLIPIIAVNWRTRHLPGWHSVISVAIHPMRGEGIHIPYIFPTRNLSLDNPWQKYAKRTTDLITTTSLTSSQPTYITSSPRTAHLIASNPRTFQKPVWEWLYQSIAMYGQNLVISEGKDWKRHRDVVKHCFSDRVNEAVRKSMEDAWRVMKSEEGVGRGGVLINLERAVTKLTLLVIADIGFGFQMPWTISASGSDKDLGFEEAMDIVDRNLVPIVLVPEVILRNSPWRSIYAAKKALHAHLFRLAREKRAAIKATGELDPKSPQLFNALVSAQFAAEDAAGETTGYKVGLSEDDVNGNMFILLLSGHETSSHAMSLCITFLAVYPEEQDKLAQHIASVWPEGHEPSYRDLPLLTYTLACLFEGLRLRDIVMYTPKAVMEDTILPYTTWDSNGSKSEHSTRVEKGSFVIIDHPAMSSNPHHWQDPEVYRPERFLEKDWPRDAFFAFSAGQRGCIGKKFSEVEMVCFISHLIHGFKVDVVPEFDGETTEQIKTRVLTMKEGMTLTPPAYKLKLTSRV